MAKLSPIARYRIHRSPPLSPQQFADLVGVDRTTVLRWESGKRRIDIERLSVIAAVTGIAPAVLRPDLASVLQGPGQ